MSPVLDVNHVPGIKCQLSIDNDKRARNCGRFSLVTATVLEITDIRRHQLAVAGLADTRDGDTWEW